MTEWSFKSQFHGQHCRLLTLTYNLAMTYRLLILLICLAFAIPEIAIGADSKEIEASREGVSRLPFYKVAPLPGALAISAGGRIAAHIGATGDIVIWDASQLKPLEIISAGNKKPSSIALSPDGELIAIGYFDSRLFVRSIPEKKPMREFIGHSGGVSALSFSPDGRKLASGGDDATTQLWDIATGKRLQIFDSMSNSDISEGSGIPVLISFSGDGQALIVNEWYSRFYDVGRGTTIWSIKEGFEISTRKVAPPNSDNTMRSGQALGGKGWLLTYTGEFRSDTDEPGLMVERLDRCDSARQLPSGGFADTVAADPLGRWIAAASDGKLIFFGMNTDKIAHTIKLPAKVIALVPHPDGRSVFGLMIADTQRNGNDRFIFGRDAETVTGGALYRIPVPTQLWHLSSLSVREDATLCPPTRATRLQQDFKLPENPVELMVIAKLIPTKEMTTDPSNPTGEYNQINPPSELYFNQKGILYALYQGNSDFRSGVAVWDLQTKRLLHSRFGQQARGNIIRLRLGWGAADNNLIDLLTGKRFSSVSNDDDKSHSLTVTSDPDTGQVFRLTAKNFERYAADGSRLPNIKTKGNVIDYAVRNGRLAALYEHGNVQVWQLEPSGDSKTYKLDLKIDDGAWADNLALSADGHYLRVAFQNASGDGPTLYATYRLSTGKQVGGGELLAPLPARANRAVVPDTRPNHLAVWDFDKGEIIARLPRHRSRNKDGAYVSLLAAISDGGRLLASASHDGLVRIWDLAARQMIGEGRVGSAVATMAFDSVGRQLAVGRGDGQLVVFQVPDPK